MMPRMSGPELVERIRHERPDLPALLMSGHASGVLKEYAMRENFLQKPFLVKQLTVKVAELLNGPKTSDTIS